MLKKSISCAALALCLSAASARAGTAPTDVNLTVGSGWSNFLFFDVGSNWTDYSLVPVVFDFTLTSSALLKVTDAYLSGDQFRVSIAGPGSTTTLDTSTPGAIGQSIGNNFDAAYAGTAWSHLGVVLGPGTYQVGGSVLQSLACTGAAAGTYCGGTAAVELVAVPGPIAGAGLPALLGLIGFGLFRRRGVKQRVIASNAAGRLAL